MSGPKISVYELTGWARANVNGQMRCEQQSMSCANQIETSISYILGCRGTIDELIGQLKVLNNRCEVDVSCMLSLQDMLAHIEKESTDLLSDLQDHRPHISEKYQISEEALAEKKQLLAKLKEIKQRSVALQDRIECAIKEASAVAESLENVAQDSIAEDISASVYLDFNVPPEEDIFSTEKSDLETRLRTLLLDNGLPSAMIIEINEAIGALDRIVALEYLHTFSSVTVKTLENKIKLFRAQKEEENKLRAELLERYTVVCQLANIEANSNIASFDVEKIEEEIARVELLAVKQREQEYISDCVEEVLTEMGYEFLGSREVKKKSGKRFRNELFSFDEGTAVNVTFSSDGQIAMELGGIAHEDRLPNDDETRELTEDMETFCGEFAEIERKLREKGVVVGSRIAMSPPSAEYAAIINVDDYELETNKQIVEMATRKKKKRTAAKNMRRENN